MKDRVIQNVKFFKGLKEDKSLDGLIESYFDLGEKQLKHYIGTEYLTDTLYLLIQEFVIQKIRENFINDDSGEVYDYEGLDEYFEENIKILNNYKRLVKIER